MHQPSIVVAERLFKANHVAVRVIDISGCKDVRLRLVGLPFEQQSVEGRAASRIEIRTAQCPGGAVDRCRAFQNPQYLLQRTTGERRNLENPPRS